MKPIQVIAGILALVIFGFFIKNTFSLPSAPTTPTAQVTQEISAQDAAITNGVQEIDLSWGKFNYAPEAIRVKKGMPVKITADTQRLTGCYRSLEIPELGVSKTITETDNVIEFTPEKEGTFTFSCAMGMGNGKIIVV